MPTFSDGKELARLVWRQHFRIPELLYWALLALTSVFFFTGDTYEAIVCVVLMALWISGIARWHWHRHQSRSGLVIPRFSMAGDTQGRALRTQETIVTSLEDKLTPEERSRVHAIPAVVGTDNRKYAAVLCKRLRARLLLHGRIEEAGGSWAVFARTAQTLPGEGIHLDPHTRDAAPTKRSWGLLVEVLTPTKDVVFEEYPFEFASELQAVVQGSAGQLALELGDHERAEQLLTAAIDVAPTSPSHQIDELRIARARATFAQDHHEEALDYLRQRAQSGQAPSPELLRRFALLSMRADQLRGHQTPGREAECIAALELAMADSSDPRRDQTIHNLANLIGVNPDRPRREEGNALLEDLYERNREYRRSWYLKKTLGSIHWYRGLDALQAGNGTDARAHFKRASKLYRAAIRARPRVIFLDSNSGALVARFPPSPVMHSNAADACQAGGQPLRFIWHKRRAEKLRARFYDRALKRLRRGQWRWAYANADWMTAVGQRDVTGQHDPLDTRGHVLSAVALKQMGQDAQAEEEWAAALSQDPELALFFRAALVESDEPIPLERGLPGTEPAEFDGVREFLGLPPDYVPTLVE